MRFCDGFPLKGWAEWDVDPVDRVAEVALPAEVRLLPKPPHREPRQVARHDRKAVVALVAPAEADREVRDPAVAISTICSRDCQRSRSQMLRLATLSSFPVRGVWIRLA